MLVKLESITGNEVSATTSLKIAEFTRLLHKNVLQSIENLVNSGKLGELNFQLSNYKTSQGKLMPMYILDETFTTVLLMGFTGDKALDWKIAYTEAFQEMRSELSKPKTVKRVKGDDLSELNRLMLDLGIQSRTKLEGKTDHKGYCIQTARIVNILCFGEHREGIRQDLNVETQARLNKILGDVARLSARGITNPTQVYNELEPKYGLTKHISRCSIA